MLAEHHADRRQLTDLVATEPSARPALLVIESTTTPAARVGVVIDDLIHLILRLQIATRTAMPGLPTGLATLAVTAHQFLGLRARLGPPLRP
jgi:hypothetical protein